MGTTAYGNARRERNRLIRDAALYAAAAAVEYVEALDERNSDYGSHLLNERRDTRHQELIDATRQYIEACRS